MALLEVPAWIRDALDPEERLLAFRPGATFDRRQDGELPTLGVAGDLYLTTSRLVLYGRVVLVIRLAEIEEIDLMGERLMIATGGGHGVAIDVDRPRLLRVQIGTARSGVHR